MEDNAVEISDYLNNPIVSTLVGLLVAAGFGANLFEQIRASKVRGEAKTNSECGLAKVEKTQKAMNTILRKMDVRLAALEQALKDKAALEEENDILKARVAELEDQSAT
jgi:hypothetical protein